MSPLSRIEFQFHQLYGRVEQVQCTEPQGGIYPRKAVAHNDQDHTDEGKDKVKQEGNKGIDRKLFPVLQEHRKRDESRQKPQYDA